MFKYPCKCVLVNNGSCYMNKCFIYLTFIDIHWFARILPNGYFIQMNIEYVIFLWGFEYYPCVSYLTDFDLDPRSISPREAGRCTLTSVQISGRGRSFRRSRLVSFLPRREGVTRRSILNGLRSLSALCSIHLTH